MKPTARLRTTISLYEHDRRKLASLASALAARDLVVSESVAFRAALKLCDGRILPAPPNPALTDKPHTSPVAVRFDQDDADRWTSLAAVNGVPGRKRSTIARSVIHAIEPTAAFLTAAAAISAAHLARGRRLRS